MGKGIRRFLFYETSNDHYKHIKEQVMGENRKFAIIWAAAQMVYWFYCMMMSFAKVPDFVLCRNIYLVSFVICVAALVLAIFAAPRVSWLIPLIIFAVDFALLGAGIGIARHLAPKTIIIFASVLIVPVFFICDSLTTLMILLINAAAFAVIGKISMEPEIFRWTLVNLLIFSSVGFVLGFFVNKARFERYYYAEAALQLAETNARLAEEQTRYANYDQMTGLQNRRAYSLKIDHLMENMPAGCCVIMADINGLKKLNDTYGHEAGDELIIGSAECLRKSFKDVDSIYRIGGDEFCVIMEDTEDTAAECLQQLEKNGREWKGKYVNGISISYGFAADKESDDFNSMLKAADKRMYESKSNYYRTSGIDRRHR